MASTGETTDVLSVLRDKSEHLLLINVVAQLLHVSVSTVYRLVEEGNRRAIRTGLRNTLILESSLKEYLQSINASGMIQTMLLKNLTISNSSNSSHSP